MGWADETFKIDMREQNLPYSSAGYARADDLPEAQIRQDGRSRSDLDVLRQPSRAERARHRQ